MECIKAVVIHLLDKQSAPGGSSPRETTTPPSGAGVGGAQVLGLRDLVPWSLLEGQPLAHWGRLLKAG